MSSKIKIRAQKMVDDFTEKYSSNEGGPIYASFEAMRKDFPPPPSKTNFDDDYESCGHKFREIMEEAGYRTVPITSVAARFFKHGDVLTMDDTKRNESFYQSCLHKSHSPNTGFAVFFGAGDEQHHLHHMTYSQDATPPMTALSKVLNRCREDEERGLVAPGTFKIVETHVISCLGGGGTNSQIAASTASSLAAASVDELINELVRKNVGRWQLTIDLDKGHHAA